MLKSENEMPPKAIKMAKRKLRDISNLHHAQGPLIQDGNLESIPETANDYIEQLRKENRALVKAIAHRNVLIQKSEIEFQRLKLNLERLKAENRELALSHSQILSELNFGKDQLKVLHHGVSCKGVLLRLRKPDTEPMYPGGSSRDGVAEKKPLKRKRRRPPRSSRVRLPASVESDDGNETVSILSRCVKRRRPDRLKGEESEDNKNPEIAAAEDPLTAAALPSESTRGEATEAECTSEVSEPSQSAATTGSDSERVSSTRSRSEEGEVADSSTRLSSSRPSRAAAKRIQSYKEIPINAKMRRSW